MEDVTDEGTNHKYTNLSPLSQPTTDSRHCRELQTRSPTESAGPQDEELSPVPPGARHQTGQQDGGEVRQFQHLHNDNDDDDVDNDDNDDDDDDDNDNDDDDDED